MFSTKSLADLWKYCLFGVFLCYEFAQKTLHLHFFIIPCNP